ALPVYLSPGALGLLDRAGTRCGGLRRDADFPARRISGSRNALSDKHTPFGRVPAFSKYAWLPGSDCRQQSECDGDSCRLWVANALDCRVCAAGRVCMAFWRASLYSHRRIARMKLFRLFGAIFSLSLRRELAFRAHLVFQGLMTIVGVISGLAVLGIIYTQTHTLGGWSLGEAITLLGTFQVVSGILSTFIEPNVMWFSDQVKDGKLDHVLIQPVPSIFLVSLGTCAPLALSQVVVGVV